MNLAKKHTKRRAIIFSLYMLPFMINIALVEFIMPIKYDSVLDNLPLMGLLITIAWLASTIFDFAIGDLTDRIGIRKTIQVGVLFSFIGSLLFGFSNNFLVMTVGILLWGFSYTFLAIPSEAYLFSSFKKQQLGSAYGWFFFFYDVSYALSPLIALGIAYFYGINSAIIVAGIFVLLTFFLASYILGKSKETIPNAIDNIFIRDGFIRKEWKDLFKMNKKEFSILLNMFVCGFWFTIVILGAPLLFFHEQHNIMDGAILSMAFMIPLALMELFNGRLANSQKLRINMIKYGFLIGGILLIVFFFVQQFWLLLFIAALITFSTNAAWTASEVSVSQFLPTGKKGEFTGIFIAAKDIGFDIAPLFYGILAAITLKVPFLILGVMLLIAWLFFIWAWRKN